MLCAYANIAKQIISIFRNSSKVAVDVLPASSNEFSMNRSAERTPEQIPEIVPTAPKKSTQVVLSRDGEVFGGSTAKDASIASFSLDAVVKKPYAFAVAEDDAESGGFSKSAGNAATPKRKCRYSADKTLAVLHLSYSIGRCEQRLKRWISRNIFRPLEGEIAIFERLIPSFASITSTNSFLAALASQPDNVIRARGANLVNWVTCNASLSVLQHNFQAFLCTVKDLALGDNMEMFRWNKHALVEQQLLSHSEFVFRMLCVYFDFLMPAENRTLIAAGPFSRSHCRSAAAASNFGSSEDDTQFTGFRVAATARPFHVDVVAAGDYYEIQEGSSNVLCAIVVFLALVRRTCNGYVGLLNLSSQSMDGLLAVVD